MKTSHLALAFAVSLIGCAAPSSPEAASGAERLTLTSSSAEQLSGIYDANGVTITFSARAIAGGAEGEVRSETGALVEFSLGASPRVTIGGADVTSIAGDDARSLAQLEAFIGSPELDAIVLMSHEVGGAVKGDARPLGAALETVGGAIESLPTPEDFATSFEAPAGAAYSWTGYVGCYGDMYSCWDVDRDDHDWFLICRGAFYDCIAQV